LQINREIGFRSSEMSNLDNLGNLALYRYQYSQARHYQLQALHGAQELGDRVSESYSQVNLAHGFLMTGDYSAAYDHIQAGRELIHAIGDLQGKCNLLVDLCYFHLQAGDLAAARLAAEQAQETASEQGFHSELAWTHHLLVPRR
jgi:hypothetical protein